MADDPVVPERGVLTVSVQAWDLAACRAGVIRELAGRGLRVPSRGTVLRRIARLDKAPAAGRAPVPHDRDGCVLEVRAGGRPAALSQVQLDQAQRMYDEDHLTVEEIAKAFRVGRSTLYENLAAYKDGRDCVLVVYRNTRPGKVDDSNRRYGETGQSEKVQLEADRKWWPVAPARQARLKGIVYVVNTLGLRLRDPRPHVKGKIREYLPL